VFIVEDNPDTRRVMEMMLESGCQLTMSPSYDKALSAARSLAQDGRSPDVLLLDIHLGEDRTGIDLLQTLREDIDTFANIPAVACTAFAQSSDRERYLREGFDAYLSKPFGTEEVVAVIREAVADADAEASS
jgi:CheY-like chemotaxis protein